MREVSLAVNNSASNIRVLVALNIFDKARGLMFLKSTDKALLLLECNCIHTFFMRFSIDAFFIDKNNRIIKIQRNINPYRILLPVLSASKVLEFPCGLLYTTGLKLGDLLAFPEL
jgi:uncharacterized membrane protein (UPF0127 family)